MRRRACLGFEAHPLSHPTPRRLPSLPSSTPCRAGGGKCLQVAKLHEVDGAAELKLEGRGRQGGKQNEETRGSSSSKKKNTTTTTLPLFWLLPLSEKVTFRHPAGLNGLCSRFQTSPAMIKGFSLSPSCSPPPSNPGCESTSGGFNYSDSAPAAKHEGWGALPPIIKHPFPCLCMLEGNNPQLLFFKKGFCMGGGGEERQPQTTKPIVF